MPYQFRQRSIWGDVARVVFMLAILLAPLAYLGLDMMGGSGGRSSGGVVASGHGPSDSFEGAPSFSQWARSHRGSFSSMTNRGLGGTSPTSNASAPFSASWRSRVASELSGMQSASHGAGAGGGVSVGGPSEWEPKGASATGRVSSSARSRASANAGADWRGAARRLASNARALSHQLGQMGQEANASRSAQISSGKTAKTSAASATAEKATTNRSAPDPPNPVPIDDHLHWLLAAALLWGVWRLRGG